MKREILIVVMLLCCVILHAQKKWDGEGGDGKWETALNWNDNTIPVSSDDVLLDNSILASSFDVFITGTVGTMSCHSLIIAPAPGNAIRFIIPNSNLLTNAFATTASGYSIQLKEGAVFINSSGATSGAVLAITDSMKIENNARYIHRTPRGNAAIMNTVSSAAGTEKGIVEFDVPVVSGSYIVSLTNRIFGTLIFSSVTNNNSLTYTSNGSNHVLIRGDLLINPQVSLSVGFDDTIRVKGNFVHNGNVFNLSNNGNPTVLQLEGSIATGPVSTITETNTAQPVILFSGAWNQECEVHGNILNEIIFKLDKSAKLILSAPLLVPFNVEMKKGVVKTDAINMLTLSANSKIVVDSLLTDSTYIDGPLRKLGLSSTDHFLFPVGNTGKMRWLELRSVTGDFTVEFFKSNPYLLASGMNGVDHISRIEYWSVESSSSLASADVEVSFDNVNSGGVTQLSSLRVAQLLDIWTNQGNAGTTGSAGSAGSVRSNNVSDFTTAHRFFTLASVDQNQNPLPLRAIQFSIRLADDESHFEWATTGAWAIQKFILQYSSDGIRFRSMREFEYVDSVKRYQFKWAATGGWYRMEAISNDEIISSNIVRVPTRYQTVEIRWSGNTSSNQMPISIQSRINGRIFLKIFNSTGQLLWVRQIQIKNGTNQLNCNLHGYLKGGPFYLVAVNEEVRSNVIIFTR